jgi:hypothetical protein
VGSSSLITVQPVPTNDSCSLSQYHAKDIDISEQASSSSIYLQLGSYLTALLTVRLVNADELCLALLSVAAGTLGVPVNHSSAPQIVNLNHRNFDQKHPPTKPDAAGVTGSPWPFREAFMYVHTRVFSPLPLSLSSPSSLLSK